MVEYQDLRKLFESKHPHWKQLYSDHSKAHKEATKAAKADTTNLSGDEIVDEFAKFMHTYERHTHETIPWEEMPEYQRQRFVGRADAFLRELAQAEHVSLEEKIMQIQNEGLEKTFNRFHDTKVDNAVTEYGTSITRRHVKPIDYQKWKDVLKEKDPALLGGLSDAQIAPNIGTYVQSHLMKYHRRPKSAGGGGH